MPVHQPSTGSWPAWKTRQEGYAAAFEETIPGVNTIAAPIRDASAAVTAVLSVSGPASRFDAHRMHAAKASLITAAEAISTRPGWRSSSPREAMRFREEPSVALSPRANR